MSEKTANKDLKVEIYDIKDGDDEIENEVIQKPWDGEPEDAEDIELW